MYTEEAEIRAKDKIRESVTAIHTVPVVVCNMMEPIRVSIKGIGLGIDPQPDV